MGLSVIGIAIKPFRSTSVTVLLHQGRAEATFNDPVGIEGTALPSTCNRREIYFHLTGGRDLLVMPMWIQNPGKNKMKPGVSFSSNPVS